METGDKTTITIETIVIVPVEKVWQLWTEPAHITKWNNASEDWHTPYAENDVQAGGKFVSRMEAKDGSFGFDFSGVYDVVRVNEYIAYTLDDGRKVTISFSTQGIQTRVVETFEAEDTNPVDMQRSGWQAILDHFKQYAEMQSA